MSAAIVNNSGFRIRPDGVIESPHHLYVAFWTLSEKEVLNLLQQAVDQVKPFVDPKYVGNPIIRLQIPSTREGLNYGLGYAFISDKRIVLAILNRDANGNPRVEYKPKTPSADSAPTAPGGSWADLIEDEFEEVPMTPIFKPITVKLTPAQVDEASSGRYKPNLMNDLNPLTGEFNFRPSTKSNSINTYEMLAEKNANPNVLVSNGPIPFGFTLAEIRTLLTPYWIGMNPDIRGFTRERNGKPSTYIMLVFPEGSYNNLFIVDMTGGMNLQKPGFKKGYLKFIHAPLDDPEIPDVVYRSQSLQVSPGRSGPSPGRGGPSPGRGGPSPGRGGPSPGRGGYAAKEPSPGRGRGASGPQDFSRRGRSAKKPYVPAPVAPAPARGRGSRFGALDAE